MASRVASPLAVCGLIEMGQASWLVAGIVPGLERQPLKKLGSDEANGKGHLTGRRRGARAPSRGLIFRAFVEIADHKFLPSPGSVSGTVLGLAAN